MIFVAQMLSMRPAPLWSVAALCGRCCKMRHVAAIFSGHAKPGNRLSSPNSCAPWSRTPLAGALFLRLDIAAYRELKSTPRSRRRYKRPSSAVLVLLSLSPTCIYALLFIRRCFFSRVPAILTAAVGTVAPVRRFAAALCRTELTISSGHRVVGVVVESLISNISLISLLHTY